MPELYIAEMVCNWKARSSEFGTDLREWMTTGAAKRFKYKANSSIHQKCLHYVDMLCDKPFKKL